MKILLDTNVLVSLANPADRNHSLTVQTIQDLRAQKVSILNGTDFNRFSGIQAIDPESLKALSS
ncbi:MAG: hypothetical protein ACKOS8_03365 [Gemmataceae bacterium]